MNKISQLPWKSINFQDSNFKNQLRCDGFHLPWVLHQLTALWGSDQFAPDAKLQPRQLLKRIADTPNLKFLDGMPMDVLTFRAIQRFCTHSPRGDILPLTTKQCSVAGNRFAANVPLILSAWKQYRGYDYVLQDDSHLLVDKFCLDLLKGSDYIVEDAVALRNQAMVTKSSGKIKTPDATTTVTNLGIAGFDSLPKSVKLCLLQLWVFQPHIASEYAITNLANPNGKAIPLISETIFKEEEDKWW